jgi:tetratricopeptide (TPR) repeat protein
MAALFAKHRNHFARSACSPISAPAHVSKPPREVDSAAQAQKLHALSYSLFGGVIFGLLGFFLGGFGGAIIGYIAGTALIYVVAIGFAGSVGSAASTLYMSSGSSTPGKREYSLGDALAMKGQLQDAADEYERCAVVYPDDPEPRLRLARLKRDRMHDFEGAATWFRQILTLKTLDAGISVQTSRELAELFIHKIKQPERALPVLARLIEKHGTSPAAAWAREEMTEIKQQMNKSAD